MNFLVRTFIVWLPLAIAITGLSLLVYATVQQNYRQSLNDPQIQMAEDAARALTNGAVPADVVSRGPMVDLRESLAPWIAIYDASEKPLESSGVLDGAPPQPPHGVFEAHRIQTIEALASKRYANRISWQPRADVRQAIVVWSVAEPEMFVVAGRNMREVEEREAQLSFMIFITWFALLVITFLAKILTRRFV